MKVLIIPDIHQRLDRLKAALTIPHDKAIFLGDYFDEFIETLDDTKRMAEWLVANVSNPNYTFLLGNHDVFYLFGEFPCSGNTIEKFDVIADVIGNKRAEFVSYFKLCHWIDDVCFSHAGLHWSHFEHPVLGVTQEHVERVCQNALDSIFVGHSSLLEAGRSRGGTQQYGGITWLDWSEFEPVEGIRQVVGHTPARECRQKGDNWCLDTHLHHVGILEDGKIRTERIPL